MSQMEPAWYCIRSQPKHEHIAAAHLRQIPGVEVFNPQLRLVRWTRRGRVTFTESLFPNYLFARFELPLLLEKVRYTSSVNSVLRFGDQVPFIADPVIAQLRRNLAEAETQVFTDTPFAGEEVEISAGPFQGASGIVTRVLPAKQRVQILLEIMGCSISAEFSLDSILSHRRNAADLVLRPADSGCRKAA